MQGAFQSDYKTRGVRWAGAVTLPPLPDGATILETGCGNGKTLSALSSYKTIGIDIAPEAVRLAGSSNAVAGDVRCLPFKDESFDCVFCWHVLGHLNEFDRQVTAAELYRVLKSGGRLFFKAFSDKDFRCGKGDEVEPKTYLRGDGAMTHYFTAKEVKGLFGEGEVSENSWEMRIKGVVYPRAEIFGVFEKPVF